MANYWDDPDPPFNADVEMSSPALWCHLSQQTPISRSPSPTMAASPHEAEASYTLRTRVITFPRFTELPELIRKMIWQRAIANDPRIFEIQHPDLEIYSKDGKRISDRRKLVKPRALTAVCVESRNRFSEVHLGPENPYLINFDVDTIYFGPNSYWFHEVLWRPPSLDIADKALYAAPDLYGYQKRQKWNHWRSELNQIKGEEEDYDPYQHHEQTRYASEENPYHPLLSSDYFKLERQQILNVAFDLEFWNETAERRFHGQTDLLYRFPCVKKVILAAGDVGESMDIKRIDHGIGTQRKEVYRRRLKANLMTAQMAITHTGPVKFHPGAVETELKREVKEITGDRPCQYPIPVTMCVSRGGRFKGHLCRFEGNVLPQELAYWRYAPGNCPYDECAYVDHVDAMEEDDDHEDDLLGRGRIPREQELEYLHDEDATIAELEDLEEIRIALNPPDKTAEEILDAVREFHASAEAGRGDDTDDEDYEGEDEMDVIEVENAANRMTVDAAEDTIEVDTGDDASTSENNGQSTKDKKKADRERKKAAKEQKKLDKDHQKAKENADKEAIKQAKKSSKDGAGPRDSETVAEITESRVHYGTLSYCVKWINTRNEYRTDKARYKRTHPMFETEHCKTLIASFHAANPDAPDLTTEKETERKQYGSMTKNGQRVIHKPGGSTASPSTPNASSSSPPSTTRQTTSTSPPNVSSSSPPSTQQIRPSDVDREESPLSSVPPSPDQPYAADDVVDRIDSGMPLPKPSAPQSSTGRLRCRLAERTDCD